MTFSDPHRERDLKQLGVSASVETDRGVCTIRLPVDAFDRMVKAVTLKVDDPPWYEDVKAQMEEAEAALRDVAYQIQTAERHANKARGVA